jgi:hypothetical protein
MNKQTAVEWLVEQMINQMGIRIENTTVGIELFDNAKVMEREQIIDAWNGGDYAYFYSKETGRDFVDGSDYYNETYKGGEQ